MKKIIIIKINDPYTRRRIIQYFIDNSISFIEAIDDQDMAFKMSLLKDKKILLLYESVDLEKEDFLKRLNDEAGYKINKTLVLNDYDSNSIKLAHNYGVDDILVQPINLNNLFAKIAFFVMGREKIEKIVEANFQPSDISKEISRAKRGNYPLSIAMVELDLIKKDDALKEFKEKVALKLRETDKILLDKETNRLLIICPFTEKNYLVEVENKVRDVFNDLQRTLAIDRLAVMYLHGLSYGVDGDTEQVLLEKLNQKIHEQKEFKKEFSKNRNWQFRKG